MKVIEILSKLKEATNDSLIEIQDPEYEGSCHCTGAATSISPVVHRHRNDYPIFVVRSDIYKGKQLIMKDFRYNAAQCSTDEEVVINGEYPVTNVSYNGLGVVTFYVK